MAKGARKLKRAQARQTAEPSKSKKKLSKEPIVQRVQTPDPLSRENLRQMALRLGIPAIAVWLIGLFVFGVATSPIVKGFALGIPAVLTIAVAVLVLWGLRQAKKAKGVAGILSQAESAEDRKAALEQIESGYKKNDPTALFARAQLLMQEDPRQALEVLEQIDLNKVLAPVADEARAQRAMIHLMLGEVARARDLADGIELNRHQNAQSRAMMAAVVSEAWARTGQSKKAAETVELFNPEDSEFEQVRPQLYRARAFAYAYTSNVKEMRKALKKLLDIDVRLLGGFLGKKTHPLLQKEAKRMLEQSGQVPRKMVVQRRV